MATTNIPDKCCASVPRVIPEGYERKGTEKTTSKGWKYYETAIDVKHNDVAVVLIYEVRTLYITGAALRFLTIIHRSLAPTTHKLINK